jgi:hypothetical protein
MSHLRKNTKLIVVAVCCIALGAGVSAIASAGAASTHPATDAHHGLRFKRLGRFARRAVQGDVIVATKTGFASVSFERGKVDSVSGQQLTITEGTKQRSYKTVTLTVPSTAKVRDNRHAASLSALAPGQRVIVLQAPKRTFVIAHTPKG